MKWHVEDSDMSEFVMIQQLIAWSYIHLIKKMIKLLLDDHCENTGSSQETLLAICNIRIFLTEGLHNDAMMWLNSLERKSDHAKQDASRLLSSNYC